MPLAFTQEDFLVANLFILNIVDNLFVIFFGQRSSPLKKLQHAMEDQIYRVLRKSRIITNIRFVEFCQYTYYSTFLR